MVVLGADGFQNQLLFSKKGRNLPIIREPLDGASSNRHIPAYMFDANNDIETYQAGLSIRSLKIVQIFS